MLAVELFVPLADNDGVVFSDDHHNAFEAHLGGTYSGFSRLNEVQGGWVHEGRVYRDNLVTYMVAIPSITDGAKVRETAELIKRHYRQEAVFVRYLGLAEVL